jgi:hypothetical protein
MGERRCSYRIMFSDLMERGYLEDLGIDGSIMFM